MRPATAKLGCAAIAVIALASSCSFGGRATVTATSVANDDAGWSMAARPGGSLLPARWLLRSHDVEGDPIDPFDDVVLALDTSGDGEGDQNEDAYRSEVRYEDPATKSTIWFRLVPLDVARSRRTLTELGLIYVEELRRRDPLDAAIAALTRGDAVGPRTSGAYIPPAAVGRGGSSSGIGTFIPGGPSWVEIDPTARVLAEVNVLAARDASVGDAPARQLLVDVVAMADPATAALRAAAIAAGEFGVPEHARLAITLVRLPGRFVSVNPYGGIEVPVVLLAGYAAPPENFAAGLADYGALLQRVHVGK